MTSSTTDSTTSVKVVLSPPHLEAYAAARVSLKIFPPPKTVPQKKHGVLVEDMVLVFRRRRF